MRKTLHLSALALLLLTACTPVTHDEEQHDHTMEQLHGNTVVSLSTSPDTLETDVETTLTFTLRDNKGNPIAGLMPHHDRTLHIVLIGEDLDSFAHIHPEDFDLTSEEDKAEGRHSVALTFPKAGRYIVALDFMNAYGSYAEQVFIDVGGEPQMQEAKLDERREKCLQSYPDERTDKITQFVSLSAAEVPCSEGYSVNAVFPTVAHPIEDNGLVYSVEKDGEPVTDLAPFLDAALHLSIVKDDLSVFMHRHGFAMQLPEGSSMEQSFRNTVVDRAHAHGVPPELTDAFGPFVMSELLNFPEDGTYLVVAQVKHNGGILFMPFSLEIK